MSLGNDFHIKVPEFDGYSYISTRRHLYAMKLLYIGGKQDVKGFPED
jgi:hypothetical protein